MARDTSALAWPGYGTVLALSLSPDKSLSRTGDSGHQYRRDR
jgi:hypothetical protein